MPDITIENFERDHLDQLIALFAEEGWTEYSNTPERTYRALTAPGVTTLVAVREERIVGVLQIQSDGNVQAHLSILLIAAGVRRTGLGTMLLREGLGRAGGLQLDIRTRTEGYYERLGARRSLGYRLTGEHLGLDAEASRTTSEGPGTGLSG